jgi:hypothetical protein
VPAVEAEQLAAARVHRRGADVEVLVAGGAGHAGVGALLDDGLLDVGHHLRVERRGDAQAAAVDLVLGGDAAREDLLLDEREHVAALPAVLALGGDLGELRQPLDGGVALLGRDGAHLGHAVEDVGVADLEVLLGLLAVGRVVLRRVVEHGGEDGGLAEVQVLGRVVEVGLGGGLDAIGAAAEVDGVEVALEDLLLAELLLDLQRDDGLADLALVALLAGEVEDLDVLLGDRRRALAGIAAGVGEERAQDALGVDALVGPEGLVLRGDHRVLHGLRHLRQRDRDAVLVLVVGAELLLAVAVVDEGGLRLERRVGRGDADRLVEHHDDATEDEGTDDTEDREDLGDLRRALLARTPRLGPPGLGLAVGPPLLDTHPERVRGVLRHP